MLDYFYYNGAMYLVFNILQISLYKKYIQKNIYPEKYELK